MWKRTKVIILFVIVIFIAGCFTKMEQKRTDFEFESAELLDCLKARNCSSSIERLTLRTIVTRWADHQINVTGSRTIWYIGNITRTKEWEYRTIGATTETLRGSHKLVLINGDKVCDASSYYDTGLVEGYNYCIYYPQQITTSFDNKTGLYQNTEHRTFGWSGEKMVTVSFNSPYDPTITSASFPKGSGNNGTNVSANNVRAAPFVSALNTSHQLLYLKFDGNFFYENGGNKTVLADPNSRTSYHYNTGWIDGLFGLAHGSNGSEVDVNQPSVSLQTGRYLNGSAGTINYCSTCKNWEQSGTLNFWWYIPTNTAFNAVPAYSVSSGGGDFIGMGYVLGGTYRVEMKYNGTLKQNLAFGTANQQNDSRWHMLTVTWDTATGNISAYIDGIYNKSLNDATWNFTGFNDSYGASTVGWISINSWDTGKIRTDEWVVYDYAQSSTEILANYQNYVNPPVLVNPGTLMFKPSVFTGSNSSYVLNWTDVNNVNLKGSIRGMVAVPNLYEYWDWSWTAENQPNFPGMMGTTEIYNLWDDATLPGKNTCLNYSLTFNGSPTYNPMCDGTLTAASSPVGAYFQRNGPITYNWSDLYFTNPNWAMAMWINPNNCTASSNLWGAAQDLQINLDTSTTTSECDQYMNVYNESGTQKYCWSTNGGIVPKTWNLLVIYRNDSGYGTTVYNSRYPTGIIGNCGQSSTATYGNNEIRRQTTDTSRRGFMGAGNQYRGGNISGAGPVYYLNDHDFTIYSNIYSGVYGQWQPWTEEQGSGGVHNLTVNATYVQAKFTWYNNTNLTYYELTALTTSEPGAAPNICDCPTSGNWEINDGSICTLSTTCNIPTAYVRVSNGRLRVISPGILTAKGCSATANGGISGPVGKIACG